MSLFKQLNEKLAAITKRDQIIAVVTATVVIVLSGNLLILKPQRYALQQLNDQEQANQKELANYVKQLADLDEAAKSGGLFAEERAKLAEMNSQIAKVDEFFAQSDPTIAQVGGLIRRLIKDDRELALVSLKMLPSTVFYAPPAPKPESGNGAGATLAELTKKAVKKDTPVPVALVDKPIYQHGVEINIKGRYPALVAYMGRIQDFPKRLFWADASISVQKFPDTSLRLVIYSLSDQALLPLN